MACRENGERCRLLLHLRRRTTVKPGELPIEFHDLHHAYLEACKAIPSMARELLIEGQDPMVCVRHPRRQGPAADGGALRGGAVAVRMAPAPCAPSPASWVRSQRARDELALSSFGRMFSSPNVGCVLMTPELDVREINAFGAQHSHVDPEAVRGVSILEIFNRKGEPRRNFTQFMLLARAGATSELIDTPTSCWTSGASPTRGWWNARVWPIFDDDDHLLGLVEWAEPFTRPTAGGDTLVRIAPGSTA